jgi:hypothetical protein
MGCNCIADGYRLRSAMRYLKKDTSLDMSMTKLKTAMSRSQCTNPFETLYIAQTTFEALVDLNMHIQNNWIITPYT